jgi:hypothetical protein
MIPLMPPPRSTSAEVEVPEALQPLVKQLCELSQEDFVLVIRAAKAQRPSRKHRAMSWETMERLKGIVSLGGNADDDCKALYDW